MKIFNKLKYRVNQTMLWMGVLNSPFQRFKLNLYIGKTRIGVPYFLPRKTVKSKTKPGYLEFKPIKVGFSSCGLGWKTKWEPEDIRFEWSPVFSFVFFGYQIAIVVTHSHPDEYWSAWLFYHLHTNKSLSKKERLISCMNHFPLIYKRWEKDPKTGDTIKITRINYYNDIVKKKYLHLVEKVKNDGE